MPTSFSKHATFQNTSYLPPDHTDAILEYTAGQNSGQRLAIYYPLGSPSDYPVNKSHPYRWAWMLYTRNDGFANSANYLFADSSATTIDYDEGSAIPGMGILWQCLMNGIAVVVAQVTSARTSNTGGTVPTGNGYFHAPGGVDGWYESRARPSAKKDAVLAAQHVLYNSEVYELSRDAWGTLGSSGGADTLAWIGAAPNRAMELGAWGPYLMPTVPRVNCWLNFVGTDFGYGDQSGGGTQFPLGETGGAGTDDTVATTLSVAPARYKREAALLWYLSDRFAPSMPHTWVHTNTASESAKFSEPFDANVSGAAAHSMFYLMALKQAQPDRVTLVTGSTGASTSGATSIARYCDSITVSDPDAYATAGMARTPGNPDSAIEFILRHINDPRWDTPVPAHGIARRGQVNATGRFIAPANPDRAGMEVIAVGAEDVSSLLIGEAPGAAERVLPPSEGDRSRVIVYGGGPIWAKAYGGALSVARYFIRELPALPTR